MATLRRFLPVLVLSFCALFTIAPQAQSVESLTIESGFLGIGCPCFDYPAWYLLQGPGVTVSGSSADAELGVSVLNRTVSSVHVFSDPLRCLDFCLNNFNFPWQGLFIDVDGTHYVQAYDGFPFELKPLLYEGWLNLTWQYTDTDSLQFVPRDEFGRAVVQAPFALTGDIVGHNQDTGEELFHLALTGHGTATITATVFPSIEGFPWDGYPQGGRFDFAAVPEPATWVLLGSGLAGVMLWRKSMGDPRAPK